MKSVEKEEVKINSTTLYPYDIVRTIVNTVNTVNTRKPDKTLDLQWKALPNYCTKKNTKAICVVDVSGSMTSGGVGQVRPIDVSLSLGLYTAERCLGPFKDYMITFSEKPELHKIVGKTIYEKIVGMLNTKWNMNTNLQAVFDLILRTAVNGKLAQSDLPDTIIIISDMQFDAACGDKTNFQSIDDKFSRVGFTRPNLVFWNVNSSGGKQFPVTVDDNGTCLVSGCSPSILVSVLNNEVVTVTPLDILYKTVNVERYDKISV